MAGNKVAEAYEHEAPESDDSGVRSRTDMARWDELFGSAPPEWQKIFAEAERRDPKMR
ncbi:MAG TPA: hypothetical protein VLS89_07970 [Candidatus Nanopelagicales bacterium]|nr:hypothetical protein [Candidatus Nanopelagicales bacterium]